MCLVCSMDRFSMNPVPDRHTFIVNVYHVLMDDFFVKMNGQAHKTNFVKVIWDCVLEMYENDKLKKDFDVDIQRIYEKIRALSEFGTGMDVTQVHTFHNLKDYMRLYIHSQKIDITNKETPTKYIEQDEEHFIKDTMDFLGMLYNMTQKTTEFSKSIRECVEIFWEYNVTWKRIQRDVTLDDIQKLKAEMVKIEAKTEMGFEHSPVGHKFVGLKKYLTDWFFYNKKGNFTPVIDDDSQKSTPDINTRVKQLEEQVKELTTNVEKLLSEYPPMLERSSATSLLQKLARHT